jgi:acyl-CoA thioesterase-1
MLSFITMMMYRKAAAACFGTFVGLASVGLATMSGTSQPAQAQEVCPAGQIPPLALPATKKRLASNGEVTIVALGSSSTEGWMATAPARTYPARLQSDLSTAFPLAHIAVINRGIGGQDALEEVARLDTDVLAIRPDLVIWQVGANGAMEHSDPEVFRKLVSTGIVRLKSLGIDVILMDNQRSPMILASPEHGVMEQILADLSVKYKVSLFSRGALMDGWQRGGMPYADFLANDSVHMNDFGYRCVGDSLAAAIEAGLGLHKSQVATAHAGE